MSDEHTCASCGNDWCECKDYTCAACGSDSGSCECDHQQEIMDRDKKIERLRENIDLAIQCLTSRNSVFVSDPRPALKYLKKGLNEEE